MANPEKSQGSADTSNRGMANSGSPCLPHIGQGIMKLLYEQIRPILILIKT